jgi:hypothetical protein
MKQNYITIINAPVEEVFSLIEKSDYTNQNSKIRLYGKEDKESLAGTKYQLKVAGFSFDGTIIAYEKPTVFAVGLKNLGLSGTFSHRLVPLSNVETQLESDLEIYEGNKITQIALVFLPKISKIVDGYLAGIKKQAEKN